ncbi:histone-lysine N-methyltransferase SETMAR [Trichonephila clavipes]|nr:histone-lysine N-methyltransferase SETMAR [Trichonephila clavipes]
MHSNERLMLQLPPRWISFPIQPNSNTSICVGYAVDEVDIHQLDARITIDVHRTLPMSEMKKLHVPTLRVHIKRHLSLSAHAFLCNYRSYDVLKLPSRDMSLQESDRSGRPFKIDNDVLRSMLENNPYLTSPEISEELDIYHTTVGDYIKSLGFVLKLSVSVPHELTQKNLSDRVRMCLSHLIKHNVKPFLDNLITEDEKRILY